MDDDGRRKRTILDVRRSPHQDYYGFSCGICMDRSWRNAKRSKPAVASPRGFVLRSLDIKRSMRESSGTVATIALVESAARHCVIMSGVYFPGGWMFPLF